MSERDWCAEAAKLREIYEAVRNGESITEARFGDDFNKYKSADLDRIERDMKEAEYQCELSQGPRPRRRFALGVRAKKL